jgi:hypothetical protein
MYLTCDATQQPDGTTLLGTEGASQGEGTTDEGLPHLEEDHSEVLVSFKPAHYHEVCLAYALVCWL